jgi:hypothetical protein
LSSARFARLPPEQGQTLRRKHGPAERGLSGAASLALRSFLGPRSQALDSLAAIHSVAM